MERKVKSSIHIKKANEYYILHSIRANYSHSVVFTDEKNEYLYDKKTAFKIFRDKLKKRKLAYIKKTGKKLPKHTIILMSAIINLNKNHNLEDVKKIVEYLEKTLDTKAVSVAIHRDEGKLVNKQTEEEFYSGEDFILNPNDNKLYWVDRNKNLLEPIDLEKFEIIKNYHAHIEFLGLDTQGNAIKRNKLTKWYLSNLQTFVANTLKMERGYNYYKSNKKAPKRLDVAEFKKAGVNKRKGKKEELAKVKDLKEENKRLRALLKGLGAEREDYAYLEQFVKELKDRIKKKNLTIQELQKEIEILKKDLEEKLLEIESPHAIVTTNLTKPETEITEKKASWKEVAEHYINLNELKDIEIEALKKENEHLQKNAIFFIKENEKLKKENSRLEQGFKEKLSKKDKEIEFLKKDIENFASGRANMVLEQKYTQLEEENEKLKKENNKLKEETKKLKKDIDFYKYEYDRISKEYQKLKMHINTIKEKLQNTSSPNF